MSEDEEDPFEHLKRFLRGLLIFAAALLVFGMLVFSVCSIALRS